MKCDKLFSTLLLTTVSLNTVPLILPSAQAAPAPGRNLASARVPLPLGVHFLAEEAEYGDWYGPDRYYYWALRIEKDTPVNCNGNNAEFVIYHDVVDRDGGAVHGPALAERAYLDASGVLVGVSSGRTSGCELSSYKWIPSADGRSIVALDPFGKSKGTYRRGSK